MPRFPYMREVYESIPRPFRDYGQVYADAPRLAYEKQLKDAENARLEAENARQQEELVMKQQEEEQQRYGRHLENAAKLFKLGGTGAAMGYLDKFLPGHGITQSGATSSGSLLFSVPHSGGKGSTTLVGDPVSGGIYPADYFEADGFTPSEKGLNFLATAKPKDRASFKAYISGAKARFDAGYGFGNETQGGKAPGSDGGPADLPALSPEGYRAPKPNTMLGPLPAGRLLTDPGAPKPAGGNPKKGKRGREILRTPFSSKEPATAPAPSVPVVTPGPGYGIGTQLYR